MCHIGRANINVYSRACRNSDFFRFKSPHSSYIMHLVMIGRMRDHLAFLERLHARETSRQTDMKLIDRESSKAKEQKNENDSNREDALL